MPTPAITATPGVPGTTLIGVGLPASKKLVTVNGLLLASVALASKPVVRLAATVKVVSSATLLVSLPSTGGVLLPMVSVRVAVSVNAVPGALSLKV